MLAWCLLTAFFSFFNLKPDSYEQSLHWFLCFYLLEINLAHINYIILWHDLFDYSQECQNCHKTATIAHTTASIPKTYFFPLSRWENITLLNWIPLLKILLVRGKNLWSGRTSSFTLPEHLSTKNLTKNKYTNDSWQKLNVRVTLRKEMMDYQGYKGHFDNSIIYSFFVSLNEY